MSLKRSVLLAALVFACTATTGHAASSSVECVQSALNTLGFSAGPSDGLLGNKTRAAALAYLASDDSLQEPPALSSATAGVWCKQLAERHKSLRTLLGKYLADLDDAAKTVRFRNLSAVFAGDVSEHNQKTIETAAREAEEYYSELLSAELSPNSTVYVSGSPAYLARVYVRHRRIPKSAYANKREAFARWITGEATYDGIFINTSSIHFGRGTNHVRRLVYHELFHLFQYQLVGPKTRRCCRPDKVPSIGPLWLFEGAASYLPHHNEQEVGIQDMSRYLDYARSTRGDLGKGSLEKLETRNGLNDVDASYHIAAYAVHLLVERNGVESLATFYRELGNRNSWKDAFAAAFGLSANEFYETFND